MEKKYAALRKALAEELGELRRERAAELSQRALSEKIGMDLGGLERGERIPAISALWELAAAFRMTPSRLVARIDKRYRQAGGCGAMRPPFAAELRRLRRFMDDLPTMKWLADRQQNCMYCNRPLLQYLGCTFAEVSGQGWGEFCHPEDRTKYADLATKAFARRQMYVSKFRLRRADGGYVWVVQQATPQFTPKGVFIGFLGTIIPEPEG